MAKHTMLCSAPACYYNIDTLIFAKIFAMRFKISSLVFSFLFLLSFTSFSQPVKKNTPAAKKPKLVVGIVIDQMRWDYLYRFNSLYGKDGFNRMINQGFSCENTFIPYMPTYTAPGHTCVYTGSVPAFHGIVGNNWYDKTTKKNVYCTEDSTVNTVGSTTTLGKMSPRNMWTNSITDELRLSNNFKSKVIGISLKDRGAILPAGHSANAAYWYDDTIGKWISSTYYMNALPQWVDDFNSKDLPGVYMRKDWNTLLPIAQYDLSSADDQPYEKAITGETSVTFPHKMSGIGKEKYAAFKYTPYAMSYTFDFAKEAVVKEQLGDGAATDFLAVSISSTDYIGHNFGPNSIEVEDAYLRLDRDIAGFLQYLDTKLGAGNYLVFLSADHAVAHVPGFLKQHNMPGGTFEDADIAKELDEAIQKEYGIRNSISSLQNYQVYFDDIAIKAAGKNIEDIKSTAIQLLRAKPFIVTAAATTNLVSANLPEPQNKMFNNGYNPKRSGDVFFTIKPGYFDGSDKGTTHGLWNPYDAHIPLLFYGWNVKAGKTNRETYMTDIAATVAAMLQIQMPNGCVGKVITEAIK
jgi:predicted AlkP superfamily pyrophosphatase or phosphodiesterase